MPGQGISRRGLGLAADEGDGNAVGRLVVEREQDARARGKSGHERGLSPEGSICPRALASAARQACCHFCME